MILGISTSVFYKSDIDQFSHRAFDIIRKCSCNAVEISCIDFRNIKRVEKLELELLKGFKYKSLHAPGLNFEYRKNKETTDVLDKISQLYEKFKFDYIILHPDRVENWDVLEKYKHLPIAIENMDSRKETGKSVEQLKPIFKKIDIKMLLDLLHCCSIDTSLNNVRKMYNEFKSRIIEFHISGQGNKPGLHRPLYRNKQDEIINAIPEGNIPIIIESVVMKSEDIIKEVNYIRKKLA